MFEFGEVAGYMLVPDGTVSASDGTFDVSEGSVDPLERGGQSDLAARSSDDRLMDARENTLGWAGRAAISLREAHTLQWRLREYLRH